jgi:hypothetical protein
VVDCADEDAVSDAGDEVADVVMAVERRHGVAIGLGGALGGEEVVLAACDFGLVDGVLSLEALGDRWVGMQGLGSGRVGQGLCGHDFSHPHKYCGGGAGNSRQNGRWNLWRGMKELGESGGAEGLTAGEPVSKPASQPFSGGGLRFAVSPVPEWRL